MNSRFLDDATDGLVGFMAIVGGGWAIFSNAPKWLVAVVIPIFLVWGVLLLVRGIRDWRTPPQEVV